MSPNKNNPPNSYKEKPVMGVAVKRDIPNNVMAADENKVRE